MDFNAMFGTTPATDKDAADYVEGAQAGILAVATIHERLLVEFGDRSRAFREGMLEAVRDAL